MRRGTVSFFFFFSRSKYEDMCMINGGDFGEKRFGRENRNRLSFSSGVFIFFFPFLLL